MSSQSYSSDPVLSPDMPATNITLTKKNYVDTYFYGLPITATPPTAGQSPILNGSGNGWDWFNPATATYATIYNNGSSYGNPGGLNFTGNVSVNSSGYGVDINISSTYPTIYNNGSSYGSQSGINFTGGCAVSSSGYGVDVYVTPGPQGPQGDPGPQGPPGAVNSVNNTGAATSMVQNPGSNSTIYIKDVQAGGGMTIVDNGNYLTFISTGGGESYPAIYGNGSGYGNPSGINFTGSVSVSYSGYGVDVNVSGGGSTDIQNTGSGNPVVQNPGTGNPVYIKGISAGSNITVTDNGSYLQIDSSAGSYPTIYSNGSSFGTQAGLNFTGNVTVSSSGYGVDIDAPLQTITLTGDITGSGTGSFATTISNSAVTYAKIQNVAANRLLGNPTGSSAAPSEIPLGAGLTFSGGALTATGVSGITALTQDVTASGSGSVAATVIGLRGTALSATSLSFGQGYVYLPNGLNLFPVDINWLQDQSNTQVTVSTILSTEQTIYTNNLSAGLIAIAGQAINFQCQGVYSNATTLKFYFGNTITPIFSISVPAPSSANTAFICNAKIVRRTSTTAYASVIFNGGDVAPLVIGPFNSQVSGLNFSSGITWKLTGTSTIAINSMTGWFYRVNFGA